MLTLAILALVLQAPVADQTAADDPVAAYLARCEAARREMLAELRVLVDRLAEEAKTSPEAKGRLARVEAELKAMAEAPAPFLPLPLPPAKGDMGVFRPAQRGEPGDQHWVDVLEIVGDDDCIVRAWYVPADGAPRLVAGVPTFVDLWVHGVATADMTVGKRAPLPQVFRAMGSKTFDTTCGGRTIPQVEPVAISR